LANAMVGILRVWRKQETDGGRFNEKDENGFK
jgi:hypothetical protein